MLELAGIRDVLAKSLGTTNPINMAKATVHGLQNLRRPEDVAKMRGKTITEVLPYRAPARRRCPSPRSRRAGARDRRGDDRGRGDRVVKVTQVKSAIGQNPANRARSGSLGLGRIGQTNELKASPSSRVLRRSPTS